MSKMGRPKSDNPKNKKVSTRLSEAEYDRLKLYASKHSLTISEVINLSLEYLYSSREWKWRVFFVYLKGDQSWKRNVKIVEEEFFVKVKHFVKRKVDIRMNIKIPLEIGRQFNSVDLLKLREREKTNRKRT